MITAGDLVGIIYLTADSRPECMEIIDDFLVVTTATGVTKVDLLQALARSQMEVEE